MSWDQFGNPIQRRKKYIMTSYDWVVIIMGWCGLLPIKRLHVHASWEPQRGGHAQQGMPLPALNFVWSGNGGWGMPMAALIFVTNL